MTLTRMSEMDTNSFLQMVNNAFPPPGHGRKEYSSWLETMAMKGTAYPTIYVYAQTVKEFLEFVQKSPRNVTEQDLKAYVLNLQSKGKSPGTIQNYLVRVGLFLKSVGNPVDVYKYAPKLPYRVPEYLTEEEIDRMIDAVDEDILDSDEENKELGVLRFKALFTLLRDTGVRATEACNLTKSDIDFNERLLTVRRGKRGKYRTVPISSDTLNILKKYWALRTDNLPFVFEYKGKKMDRLVVWRYTKRVAEKAGVNKQTRTHGPSIHPHLFRHSFATLELKRLINSGKGRMDAVLIVKEALGHSDINTTLIYLTLLGEDIRDMMGR